MEENTQMLTLFNFKTVQNLWKELGEITNNAEFRAAHGVKIVIRPNGEIETEVLQAKGGAG